MAFKPDEYICARRVEEVVQALTAYKDQAAILAGGTVFHELVAKGMVPQIKKLIDISRLPLSYISDRPDGLRIGATTRLAELRDASVLKDSGAYRAIAEAASILPVQVVEMGTVGGNICAGLPILNFPPVVLALDFEMKVTGPGGERSIPGGDFYLDYFLTGIQPEEFLVEVNVPKFPERSVSVFQAFKILSLDYPTISIAVRVTLGKNDACREVRIAFGSVGRVPLRASKAENRLMDRKLDERIIDQAIEAIPGDINPINDLRATAEYRKEISKVLARDALMKAREQITG